MRQYFVEQQKFFLFRADATNDCRIAKKNDSKIGFDKRCRIGTKGCRIDPKSLANSTFDKVRIVLVIQTLSNCPFPLNNNYFVRDLGFGLSVRARELDSFVGR